MLVSKKPLFAALEKLVAWLQAPQPEGAVAPAQFLKCEGEFPLVDGGRLRLIVRPAVPDVAVVEFVDVQPSNAVFSEVDAGELRALVDGVAGVETSWHGTGTRALVCRTKTLTHPSLVRACTTDHEQVACATCPGGAFMPAQCMCDFRKARYAQFKLPEGWSPLVV